MPRHGGAAGLQGLLPPGWAQLARVAGSVSGTRGEASRTPSEAPSCPSLTGSYAVTGLPVSTYFSAYKLKWLLDNVPAVADAAAAGRCCFGTVDSWLIYQLTGERRAAGGRRTSRRPGCRAAAPVSQPPLSPLLRLIATVLAVTAQHTALPSRSRAAGGAAGGGLHITDASNASRTALMDLRALAWHEPTLRLFGVSPDMLPQIRSNAEVYGWVGGWLCVVLCGLPASRQQGCRAPCVLRLRSAAASAASLCIAASRVCLRPCPFAQHRRRGGPAAGRAHLGLSGRPAGGHDGPALRSARGEKHVRYW